MGDNRSSNYELRNDIHQVELRTALPSYNTNLSCLVFYIYCRGGITSAKYTLEELSVQLILSIISINNHSTLFKALLINNTKNNTTQKFESNFFHFKNKSM